MLAGETNLYEILVRRNNSALYKTGRGYNYSHEDTQDLMQDTFVDAFRHLGQYGYRSSFKTWIIRIMLNHCFRKKQKAAFRLETTMENNTDKQVPLHTQSGNTDAYRSVLNRELGHVVESAMQQLPNDYRMVFVMREINGLNVAETSEALEISEANVKVRLNRAKAMLRKEVEKSYSTEEIFEFNLVYCDAMVENVMKRICEPENRF